MKIARYELVEGKCIPNWYGFAYWEYRKDVALCYPIPFNLIVRMIKNIMWFILSKIKWGNFKSARDKELSEARNVGYTIGYKIGYGAGYTQRDTDIDIAVAKYFNN